MSPESLAVVERFYPAFARRDFEAVLDMITDDFELDFSHFPVVDFPSVGAGEAHVRRFFSTYLEGFSEYRLEADAMRAEGDLVFVACHDTAHLGDAVVKRDLVQVWTVRGGRLARLQAFRTATDAQRATGLAGDAG